MKESNNLKFGFSLVEVLVVLGVIGFMAAVIAPGFFGVRGKQTLNSMTNRIVSDVRNVSERARAQEQSSGWGVRFTNPTGAGGDYYEIWYGTDYASGTKIARIAFSPGLSLTDPSDNSTKDIIFSKGTGLPTAGATVALVSTVVSPVHGSIININSSGKVDFQVLGNLVGYWNFDESSGTTAYDNAGQSNNGTLSPVVGPPTRLSGTNCKSGGCLSFDATDDYVSISTTNPNVLKQQYSKFSVAAWVYMTACNSGTYGPTVISNTDGDGWAMRINNCYPFVDFQLTGPTGQGQIGTTQVQTSTWSHVAMVYDGVNITAYINGSSVGTMAATGNMKNTLNSSSCTYVGNEPSGCVPSNGEFLFPGRIDEVYVLDRDLSSTEVKALYDMNNK